LDYQINYVGNLIMTSDTAKGFDILTTSLSIHNYFDNQTKLFSN